MKQRVSRPTGSWLAKISFRNSTQGKSLVRLVVAVATGLALVSVAPASAASAEVESPPSYLFAFEGNNAQLQPVRGQTDVFQLTIPLTRPAHMVTWFTDRPVREAGRITMRNFVRLCSFNDRDSFQADPPNVAISSDQEIMIATMTDPKIVTKKGTGRVFEATMTLIKDDALGALAASNVGISNHAKLAGQNDHQGNTNLRTVTVFVDGLDSAWRCIKTPCCCIDNQKECLPGACD